ncbi:NUDIX hydrolase [Galbitalea sp. SE-J8]|uniref:NUDIX domain-containing protein n=1 Tax=Galbitalea sp. SE-J8 TaxID=3054952 RepID=UPI00259D25FC|nr:NUDIX hydrolase [Galbitalea sp. SE-J8]MDM4762367.1 NUDIX hydrolase [Galbitalea sp. SE-J8]
MAWPVTSSETVYENPWIRVVEDRVLRPDGDAGVYGVVEVRQSAVFIVAMTDADEVALVAVDRHTVGISLEVPAGGSDGQDALEAARRELREETGLIAEDWREVGRMDALNGICRAPETVFLARGLSRADDAAEGRHEEGITDVRFVPWRELLRLIAVGEIADGETIAAVLFAAIALNRVA